MLKDVKDMFWPFECCSIIEILSSNITSGGDVGGLRNKKISDNNGVEMDLGCNK